MRRLKDLQEAEGEFFDRVWYNRKLVMLEKIEMGQMEMPDEDIMEGMTKHMRECEDKYGGEESLTYNDFDWGMVNGKLSALRWVMGDDWDMLDT